MANIKLSFNDLVEIIRLKEVEKLSSRKIAKRFGVSKSTVNYFLSRHTFPEFWEEYDSRPVAGGSYVQPEEEQGEFKGKRFLFTSIQNNSYHHEEWVNALLHYRDFINAELYVGTFTYNKNGFQNGVKGSNKEDIWYDPKLKPFICDKQMKIAEGLVWCGELNILPTAVNPLSGFANYLGSDSLIVPHATICHESIATPRDLPVKMMYTTGCSTLSNYIEKKAGQKAKWHHSFAATLVEVDEEGDWFVRQLNFCSKTKTFQDLDRLVTPNGVKEEQYNVRGIQWGDIHSDKLRQSVADACWGFEKGSMAEYLMPDYQFAHDVHDHARRNHHNIKDPYYLFKQYINQEECVASEVEKTYRVLEEMAMTCDNLVVVESNHDLALERWLREQDYRKDPVNALFFLELQLENYQAISRGEDLQTFKTACELQCGSLESNITFLKTDESFVLEGIECGQHGHNGSGGARGSIKNFAKQGVRHNLGHSHGSGIFQGVYQGGACMLPVDSGYAKGASNWSITHIVTYFGGKRTLVTMKWSEKQQRWKWRA